MLAVASGSFLNFYCVCLSDHSEAFLTVTPLGEVYEEAQRFIKVSYKSAVLL